jgi:hypothetical protein
MAATLGYHPPLFQSSIADLVRLGVLGVGRGSGCFLAEGASPGWSGGGFESGFAARATSFFGFFASLVDGVAVVSATTLTNRSRRPWRITS